MFDIAVCEFEILFRCPTCRVEMGINIRNLFMEDVGGFLSFPCKYAGSGCARTLVYDRKVVSVLFVVNFNCYP